LIPALRRVRTRPPWALIGAGVILELGWLCVAVASDPLTESRGFTDAFVAAVPAVPWKPASTTLAGLVRRAGGPSEDTLADAVVLVIGLFVATAGYLAGFAVLKRAQTAVAAGWVSMIGIVFQATLWCMPGLLSGDIVSYALYGRLGGVYGLNPYLSPPSIVAAVDPLVKWGGEPERTTLYGPLWTDLSAVLARLTAGIDPLAHVLSYRGIGTLAVLVSMALVWRMLPRFGSHGPQRSIGLLLFAWNPLLLFELVGNGHNDGFMLMLALLGLLVLTTPAHRFASGPVTALVLFGLAALVKYVPASLFVLTSFAWIGSHADWRRRMALLATTCALLAAATVALSVPWLDAEHPLQMLSNAASAGDRYVNAIWDLPTSWIARAVIDRRGHDLEGANEAVRAWPRTILRVLLVAYAGFEAVRVWASARGADTIARAHSVVEATTRILLVALLIVANQVLAWYFTWPVAIAASLGWRSSLAKLAIAYSVLYLPLFYAIHEDLVRETAPWLLTYAVAPVIWLYADRQLNSRQIDPQQRESKQKQHGW
jgi:hypothetical protein